MQVEIKDIKKYFGPVKANDGITINLSGGHIYGILGENGAGKSTLMKILSGYQSQDSGDIRLDGKITKFVSPAEGLKAGIGMLYQDPLDFPPFNILENYLLAKSNRLRLDFNQANKQVTNLAEQYGFDVDLRADIASLSLGERQQLELVRLLAEGAEMLILDEPTTGISAEQKDQLFASMRRMAYEEKKILVLVSHKLDEVQELCDHAFILRQGKLVGESEVPCPNEKLVEMMFGVLPPRKDRKSDYDEQIVLEVKNLRMVTYRLTINDINFSVNAGEVLGLAGLEGSGQGLLLRGCAGLEDIDEGQIIVNGEDVTDYSYHLRKDKGIAFMGAGRLEEGLITGLTLTEHMVLASPEQDFIINWNEAGKVTQQKIETYQVVGSPNSTADQLSGGNQQRFMFSMLKTPLKLILLEHPTRGLDVRSTDWIWEQLYDRRKDGTAILFLSADLDEVVDRSDRIAVFSGGRMSRMVNATETDVDELGHLIGGQE
ncbi:MAG: ATP-binding cassette domain-containing protein [Aliifodinibius sp.]|nr:ATP-binding cassette domain-containing protein [Fodinibius sp.]